MLDDRLKVISLVKIYEKGSQLFVVVKTSCTVSLKLHLFPSKHSFMIDDQQSNLNQQSLVSSCLSKWRPNIWRIRSKSCIDFSFLWHTNPPCSNIVWRAGPRIIWGSRQVKFHMLMLWLPLFCYPGNGLSFPVLTGYERAEVERVMEELISSVPAADQEVILNNWLQDFTISSSDWPNLQRCYDRWCQSSRNLLF